MKATVPGVVAHALVIASPCSDCGMHRLLQLGTVHGDSPTSPIYSGPSASDPTMEWMIIPGQDQWLKEFFDVKMLVTSLAPLGSGFSLDNGTITLGALPSGLSLAPTSTPQSLTQNVPDIPGGGSASADWILRGDDEGYYAVGGTYNGTLDPIGVALSLPISTASGAIHVWGGSALHMIVDADDQANNGDPYLIRIGLEDVADIPIYNADVTLKEQGRLNYIYQPKQQLSQGTDTIEPGTHSGRVTTVSYLKSVAIWI